MYIRITQKHMIGDTQVIAVRGYDLGLLDSCYIYYQAMCVVYIYRSQVSCMFSLYICAMHCQLENKYTY